MARASYGYVNNEKTYAIKYNDLYYLTLTNLLVQAKEVTRKKTPELVKRKLDKLRVARKRLDSQNYLNSKKIVKEAEHEYLRTLQEQGAPITDYDNEMLVREVEEHLNKKFGYYNWAIYVPNVCVSHNKLIIEFEYEYLDLNDIDAYGSSYNYLYDFITYDEDDRRYKLKERVRKKGEYLFILNECNYKFRNIKINNTKTDEYLVVSNNRLIYKKIFSIALPKELEEIKKMIKEM